MIPRLINIITLNILNKDLHIYLTDSGYMGVGFKSSHFDLELDDLNSIEYKLSDYLKSLPEKITVLFKSTTTEIFSEIPNIARKTDLETIDGVEHQLNIFIEKKVKLNFNVFSTPEVQFVDQIHNFISEIHLENLITLFRSLKFLSNKETKDSFLMEEISISDFGINIGPNLIGVVKLTNLANHSLNIETLGLLREKIPVPFEITVKQTKIPPIRSQANLHRKSKQEEKTPGLVSQKRFDETQNAIAELELEGISMHQFEMHITLKRNSESELRTNLKQAKEALSMFGTFKIESKGVFPSFVSTLPASYFHVPVLEKNINIPCYLPIIVRAEKTELSTENKINKGALGFHRADFSLSYFYPFNDLYTSYNMNIIGQSGFGKSLFINALLRSVLNEENSSVILVDVKGSHTKTVSQLGGEIRKVNSDYPTGINPFSILKRNSSKEVIEILLGFLSQLMLNDNEVNLPVPESIALEKELLKYSLLENKDPSIDDFLIKSGLFIRKEYLERFRFDGLFGNLFKEKKDKNNNIRFVYYDFESIQGAANKTVSTGIIAAVMADFNLRLIDKQRSEKLYLICDETPFFVRNCFSIFRLLIKNLRKLNGSLVLAAQKHEDLIVNEDLSLIEGAAIKFLFTKDGNSKTFKERFHLSDRDIEILEQFNNSPKSGYSRFLLKDELGSRIGLLRLTAIEYLRSSTTGDEVKKIEDAIKIAPHLSGEEIISILANNRLREVGLI